ncbi:hypothetical protein BS50DRAFT_448707, partial [Corynespora cassiicola Philippines]
FLTAMQRVYAFPTEASAGVWKPPPASAGHRGRYLWTDAFGVLNFLTLHQLTSQPLYLSHAKALVTAVHSTLGRTRDLSSYLPRASPSNPLAGGLRIGKDEATGPDGDGQYHHYLTMWMFVLNRLSIESGEKEYNDQAIALAKAIHPHFVYNRKSTRPRMYWKMTMDLEKPLVRSEGNLDPVDGLVVYRLLQQTDGGDSEVLAEEIDDYHRIVQAKWQGYSSSDPLDLGMTLWTAHWSQDTWAIGLVDRAEHAIEDLWQSAHFMRATTRRLAFRDFGLAMGIKCGLNSRGSKRWTERADSVVSAWEQSGVVPDVKSNHAAGPNAGLDLQPITQVMYCAALIPG